MEGILITRIRFDQARAEFERNINFMVINVEFAYWTLYGSYWTLYSREQALRQALADGPRRASARGAQSRRKLTTRRSSLVRLRRSGHPT